MNLKKNLGEKIKELRKTRKLTQEQLAELVGIDSKNISKIENGNNYPAPETISAIADALGVNIYELFIFNKDISYAEMKDEIITSLDNKETIIYLYQKLKGL